MTQRRAHEVLEFWFGTRPYKLAQLAERSTLWFGSRELPSLQQESDAALIHRFADLTAAAAAGQLTAWESGPRRRLALILLLDQFPRTIHRGQPAAYAQDHAALSLAVTGMQLGAEATLVPIERAFFYMPLQNAESSDIQEESVAAFQRLAAETPAELKPFCDQMLRRAQAHRHCIQRFGRFPMRNAILGRATTPEEAQWLAQLRGLETRNGA